MSVLRAVMMVLALVAVETSEMRLKRQVFQEGDSRCKVDDLHRRYLRPLAVVGKLIGVEGACQRRNEENGLSVDPLPTANISVAFQDLNTDLNGPFCIAMTVNTAENNVEPLVTFYDNNLTETGRIVLTLSTISITIQNSSAGFSFPTQGQLEYTRLQLCLDGAVVELYHECVSLGTESIASGGFQNSNLIVLLRKLATDPPEPYLGSVSQLYLANCGGSGVERGEVASLQCQANPPNCSQSVRSLSDVVRDYVVRLEQEQVVPTSTAVLHSTVVVASLATTERTQTPTTLSLSPSPSSRSTVTTSPPSVSTVIITSTVTVQSTVSCPTATQPIVTETNCVSSKRQTQTNAVQNALIAVVVVLASLSVLLMIVTVWICILWRRASQYNIDKYGYSHPVVAGEEKNNSH